MSLRKRTTQLLHCALSPATWVSLGIALLKKTVESTQLCWQNLALTSAGVPILVASFLFGFTQLLSYSLT